MLNNTVRRAPRGFTLVELLIVIAIILILVAVALPVSNTARQKAKDTEVKSGANSIQAALEQYAVDHSGFYPGAQWLQDSTGTYDVGPGVLGATATFFDGRPQQDFSVPKTQNDPRQPYLADGTPNVKTLDALVVNGYMTDYPANPFLKASDAGRAQMSNVFLFNPILGQSTPVVTDPDTLDWNRYTTAQTEGLRTEYDDLMRGHFSYIPLNPQNLTGIDFVGEWGSLPASQLSDYYKRCRGYLLVGWGHGRLDDRMGKGISEKYWNSSSSGFDFDMSLDVDPLERLMSDGSSSSLVGREMADSSNDVGSFGSALPSGAVNIDPAFNGAVFIKIPGS